MAGRPQNLKPFEKGDARINRKGRPKDFTGLRSLAQAISHEEALSGGQPLVVNGKVVTVAEAILRQLAQSKNPRERELFLAIAFGKVPNPVEVSGKDGGPLLVDHTHKLAEATDDDIKRTLAALGQSALAASGRTPIHDDPGDAEGDDSTGQEE